MICELHVLARVPCIVSLEVDLQAQKLLDLLERLVQKEELTSCIVALHGLMPLDVAFVCNFIHVGVDVAAAEAHQRLHLVALHRLGESA